MGASLYQERQQWRTHVTRLGAEPGLVPRQPRGGRAAVSTGGLRDPLAADPGGTPCETVGWTLKVTAQLVPYTRWTQRFSSHAPDTSSPPHTVRLAVDGTRLIAAGTAPTS